jgi:hypothetical protein
LRKSDRRIFKPSLNPAIARRRRKNKQSEGEFGGYALYSLKIASRRDISADLDRFRAASLVSRVLRRLAASGSTPGGFALVHLGRSTMT